MTEKLARFQRPKKKAKRRIVVYGKDLGGFIPQHKGEQDHWNDRRTKICNQRGAFGYNG